MNKKQFDVGIFPMVGDLLHVGHVRALERAKEVCNKLIVVMNCAPQRNNPTKNAPVESIYERYTCLKAIGVVDDVIPYEGEPDLLLLLQTVEYDVRFIGEDHLKKGEWTGSDFEAEQGIPPYVISRKHNMSSASLRERVYNLERARRDDK